MKKTSLYIEPEVDAALARRAQAEGISKAELIRRSLRTTANGAPRPRFLAIGVIEGAPSDLSTNFDRYLAESGFGED
jgi:hypothetical protein